MYLVISTLINVEETNGDNIKEEAENKHWRIVLACFILSFVEVGC